MYQFEFPYRVRYADVDQMGYMYYGNYARLYEIGRVEALRNLGIRYKDLEEQGFWMPVYENYSKFIAPAKYDENLNIRVMLKKLPAARIVFNYEILDETQAIIHTGETTLVFILAATGKITPSPKVIIDTLKPFFE